MKKTKIYLSGQITGDKHYYKKFHDKEHQLKFYYDKVFNPAKLGGNNRSWAWYICRDIWIMWTGGFTHIYMQTDWKESIGAQIELLVARKLGLKVTFEQY